MTENKGLPFQYEIAEGPDGLRSLLDAYYTKAQTDEAFAEIGHYILYTFGEQRSLIRVDTSTMPFEFRYCDLMGRPITKLVRETIAKFMWETCGEKERCMKELEGREQG